MEALLQLVAVRRREGSRPGWCAGAYNHLDPRPI